KHPVHTFTLAFEEDEYNEAPAARRMAKALRTRHREVLLTEQQFNARFDNALASLDQPTLDGINCYHISHAARDAGLKVALIGAGGDELFGGYASFRSLSTLSRWLKLVDYLPSKAINELSKLSMCLLPPNMHGLPPMTRWAKLPELIKRRS